MKKISAIVMALLMVLAISQCKKKNKMPTITKAKL